MQGNLLTVPIIASMPYGSEREMSKSTSIQSYFVILKQNYSPISTLEAPSLSRTDEGSLPFANEYYGIRKLLPQKKN